MPSHNHCKPSLFDTERSLSRRDFVAATSRTSGTILGASILVGSGLSSRSNAEVPSVQTTSSGRTNLPQIAANAFLKSLDNEQLGRSQFPYDDVKRVEWNFVPMTDRKGLQLREMNASQRELAMELLRSVVSESGYRKSEIVMQLEGVLREQEGPQSAARRDPTKYHFAIYGEPSANNLWGVSIEGHHLSLNFVFDKGHIVDSTPQFFGANPAAFQSDMADRFQKGFRLLGNEEQLGWDFLNMLSPTNRAKAIIAKKAPSEIDSPGSPQANPTSLQGVAASELSSTEQTALRALIVSYCDCVTKSVADDRMSILDNAGFDKVHFAWLGSEKPGVGHYYKVQGPTFLIEFVNVQQDAIGNVANHIHCIWRDLQGDFNLPT